MDRVRTALYLDFDNVFSGLYRLDPDAAISFAEDPGALLERLATSSTIEGPRAWLVRRCYMNPNGWIAPAGTTARSDRLYFSGFRPYFTRAGFDVVDCPSLTQGTKNAADIRLVLDAMEALDAKTHYDEFVLASGDSDLTPLLVRLRAADRRTTIVSPFDAAAAFTSVADLLIDGQRTLELLQDETELSPGERDETPAEPVDRTEALARFAAMVRERYERTDHPLNLATLAQEVSHELGSAATGPDWFGHGGFTSALRSLDLPGMVISHHWLWDSTRHEAPAVGETLTQIPGEPQAVARLCALQNVPRLPRSAWPRIYRVLADFAASHDFSMTEATKWSRDRLAADGTSVSRASIGFVMNGASYGGCPLYRTPPPDATEIGAAFVANVLGRARAAQIDLSPEDEDAVVAWLGAPGVSDSGEDAHA